MHTRRALIVGAAAVAVVLLAGLAPVSAAPAGPFVHPLFSENMVLQRGIECPVWGWAAPGEAVTVSMAGKSAQASAGADGKWMARLGPFEAGGPHRLTVEGKTERVAFGNVLVGDVWICSGQSNMQMSVSSSNNADQEIAGANQPLIRLFTVPNVTALEPQTTVNGTWQLCTPETIPWFTAVGYFFGRTLEQELKVPIGLINSSWGGTICEAWTSGPALKSDVPEFAPAVTEIERLAAEAAKGAQDYAKIMADWYAQNDPGSAEGLGWADPALATADWGTMQLPGAWEQGGFGDWDGVAWFRKTVDLPAGWAGKEATLHLGPIDDQDTTWVNGVRVGATEVYNAPRDYAVPAGVLKAGANVIAVRALDTGGIGGLNGRPEQLSLEAGGLATVPLAGEWKCRQSTPMSATTPVPPRADGNPNIVTVLYNAMIAPLTPFAIKGAIWYQGESNADRAEQYGRLLPAMIRDWRAHFGVGDFPFLIVSLANFMAVDAEPRNDPWPNLREAQWLTTKRVPNAELAITIDIGDAVDIHPKNKQEVGRRLALAALGTTSGQKIEYSGPVYKSMEVEGTKARLAFTHVTGGLEAKGGKLEGFAIAGADGKFVWADAVIDGDTVVVSSPAVTAPTVVRYGWGNNPVCTLYNGEGLPAVPFRTDGPTE
jgi:sialate O-acetylesterase